MTDWLRQQDEQAAQIAVVAAAHAETNRLLQKALSERDAARRTVGVWMDSWRQMREAAIEAQEEADTWKHNYQTSRRVRQLLERELEEARSDLALARSASGAAAAGSPAGDACSAKSNTPVKPQDVVVSDATGQDDQFVNDPDLLRRVDDGTGMSVGW